jgi:P-type Cu+ transporter
MLGIIISGSCLAVAREISTATVRNMRQNLMFAILYNTLGKSIAVGVLYPLTGMLLSPMIAAMAMSLSSLSVVVNALRLRHKNLQHQHELRTAKNECYI